MGCDHGGYVDPYDCPACVQEMAATSHAAAMRPELPADLEAELRGCLADINEVIESRKREHAADRTRTIWGASLPESIYAMLDTHGKPLLADLLAAKAQILVALARLS